MSEENLICNFCSKSRKDVTKMIVGQAKVAICNECVKLCVEILEEDTVKARNEKLVAGDKSISVAFPPFLALMTCWKSLSIDSASAS